MTVLFTPHSCSVKRLFTELDHWGIELGSREEPFEGIVEADSPKFNSIRHRADQDGYRSRVPSRTPIPDMGERAFGVPGRAETRRDSPGLCPRSDSGDDYIHGRGRPNDGRSELLRSDRVFDG